MADNVSVYPGNTGTPIVVGADVISSVAFQRFKLIVGADGVNDGDVSSANPLPVTGTLNVNPHAVTNAGNFVVQVDGSALSAIQSIEAKTPSLGQALAAASVPVVLTAAQLATLTPPSAITGFATESTLSTLNGKVTACNTGAIVVASSALPSGAATAVKQPALGTAGAAASDVLTVQGIASMVALKVDGSAVTQPVSLATVPSHAVTNVGVFVVQVDGSALTSLQLIDDVVLAEDAAHSSGDKGVMALAVRKDTATQLAGTDGDYSPLLTDVNGRLHVNIGSSVTVSVTGVSTEAKQDAGNASLASIDGKITTVNTGSVTIVSCVLPTGAATAAKQPALGTAGTASADVLTIQGIASMTAIKVDGSAVTQPVSGTVSAAQSGTWTVGISAAQTLDTVTTVGTITNVVHVDDNASSLTVDAPVGTPVFVRLSDGSSAITTLPVSLASVPSHAVTNAGTFAVQASQAGTWNVTNVSGTISLPTGAATAAKQPALGTAGTASSDVITVQGIASMTALKVDGSAVTQPVSGTVSAAQSGTWTVGLSAAQTLATVTTLGTITNVVHVDDNSGSLTVDAPVGTPLYVRLSDGAAPISTLPVSVAAVPSHDVTNAGTFSVQVSSALPAGTNAIGKLSSNSGVTIGAVEIATAQVLGEVTTITGGGRSHDAADSGNPLKIGSRSVTALSGITIVSDADRSDALSDLDGALLVRQMASHGDHVSGNASVAGTGDTSVVAAQGSGVYFYVTGFSISNTGSSPTLITIKDGNGGSTLWTTIAPAGGGSNLSCGGKPLFRTSANTALHFACATSSTTVYISVTGYKSKV